MKLFIVSLLFFFSSLLSFGETRTYFDSFQFVEFIDSNQIEMHSEEENVSAVWNNICRYSISEEGMLTFLTVSVKGLEEKFLMLVSDEILGLIDSYNRLIFFGTKIIKQGGFNIECLSTLENAEASSELREGKTLYSSQNLKKFNTPWVEGVDGQGIGEQISFSAMTSCLYFFSGYVSAQKPYLYMQNSRPKRIKVTLVEQKEDFYFDLEDTPNPQKLDIGKFYRGEIIIEILDVYPGSKYEDTCVNAIMYKVVFG